MKDPEYLDFRIRKMKMYLRKKHGVQSLGILRKMHGFESPKERKSRCDLVKELRKERYTFKEIGELMGVSSQAVNSLLKSKREYKEKRKKDKQPKLF